MRTPTHSTVWARPLARAFALFAGAVVLMLAAVALFPWDAVRGPISRYVSQETGRHVAIAGHLKVTLGQTFRVRVEGFELGNPGWAQDRDLLRADVVDAEIRLWPLLHGQVIVPNLWLSHPEIGLQEQPDGRRTWDLTPKDGRRAAHAPVLGRLSVDDGRLHYVSAAKRVDVNVALHSTQPGQGTKLPIRFEAQGTLRDQPFKANGSAGNLVQLTEGLDQPYPAEIHLQAEDGAEIIDAKGTVATLVPLGTVEGDVQVQGRSLADLYHVLGVVLPETPRYVVRAHFSGTENAWHAIHIHARLGQSDLAGELTLSRETSVPTLTGAMQSENLDFTDLAPLIGLAESGKRVSAVSKPHSATAPTPGNVLPKRPLDVHRLREMNADVKITGARILDINTIPMNSAVMRVRLEQGVLQIDPIDLGFAGGTARGSMRIDGNRDPAAAQLQLDLRNVNLTKLVSGSRLEKYISLGRVQAEVDLQMRGNSTADMLGSSHGSIALLMGSARMSKIASQAADLHLGELLGLLATGDRDIQVRCAAAAFEVSDGLMRSRALLFDSADTAVYGNAEINLANEKINIVLRQYPKEKSVLSLRSPLHVDGTLARPAVHVDKGLVAAKGGAAFAAGALSPLLALAATLEPAPGRDADCTPVLREAAGPSNAAGMARAAAQAAKSESMQFGSRQSGKPQTHR